MNLIDPVLAIGLGLAGAGHCLGMCGGLAVSIGIGSEGRGTGVLLSYHAGRVCSYALLGAGLGYLLGLGVGVTPHLLTVLRYLAGLLLIAMGLYISGWWRGLVYVEQVGAALWKPMQILAGRWIPPRNTGRGFALGLCWGAMPCGLIYSSVTWAASQASGPAAGFLMLLFGVGTLPAMLGVGLVSTQMQRIFKSRQWKTATSVLLILAGLWTLFQALNMGSVEHSHHMMS